MDFEKLKKLIIEKKVYIIVGTIILGILIIFFRNGESKQNDLEQNPNSSVSFQNKENSEKNSKEETNSSASSTESKEVTCDISGAVRKEGVYTLENGARLEELIQAAGGLKSNAQIKAINRAIILKDQDKIHIPYKGEKVENASTISSTATTNNSSVASSSSESGAANKVNLNTATATDLQKLNGIGEKKAEQIIAYRQQKGSFKKIEDLMQVSGIGEKTFEALKDQLAV